MSDTVKLELHDSTLGTFDEVEAFTESLEALMMTITWEIERRSEKAPRMGGPIMQINGKTISMTFETVINHFVGAGLDERPRKFLTTDLSRAAQYDMVLDEMDGFISTCVGLRIHEDQGLIWREKPSLSRVLTEKGMFVMLKAKLLWL